MHENCTRLWEYINEDYALPLLRAYQRQDLALLKQIAEEFVEDCNDHFKQLRQEELACLDD